MNALMPQTRKPFPVEMAFVFQILTRRCFECFVAIIKCLFFLFVNHRAGFEVALSTGSGKLITAGKRRCVFSCEMCYTVTWLMRTFMMAAGHCCTSDISEGYFETVRRL